MKKKLWGITLGMLFFSLNVYAGDGDLLVNGKVGLRTTNPTGIFEIAGQASVGSSNAIPTMTSNTTPSGIVSADSIWNSAYDSWKAMDGTNATHYCWYSASNNTYPHWLQYQFPSGKIITSYSITSHWSDERDGPRTWKLQGSNNGSIWTDLDTQSAQSFGSDIKKTFSFINLNSYTYYRLYIIEGEHGQYVSIGELELMESAGTQSVSFFYVDETSGNVGIWSNNPGSYKLYVNGSIYASSYGGSDKRWKKNIQPISNALSLVEKLQGVRFEWRTEEFKDKNFEKGGQVGLISQEVEPVIPEIVKTDTDGYKAISYEKLTAILVEAVKEQSQKIKELEAKINKMKKK
jgi:hypothetical protein